ncbi:hypothetical protein CDD83_2701 [Cordyceps sp. RAO-2017]|nr:hypothetical protein CDD83_2701 [Cordyceps sp. RAO-2017]
MPSDVNSRQSLKRLLELAQASLRQSEISRDINRPAHALQDYVRAFIITSHFIKKHAEYPTMKNSNSEYRRAYDALTEKLCQQQAMYEKIKSDIAEDNKKTGVQPTLRRSETPDPSPRTRGNEPNGHAVSPQTRPKTNGRTPPPVTSSPGKTKPIVHPKPEALHGNAIVPGRRAAPPKTPEFDLAARFANLRGPQSSPGQDPRIKTYPIPTQKPLGARPMPEAQNLNLDTDNATSALPKVPDAVYSPARGSVSGEATRLPASASRGSYSRSGSATSIPTILSLPQQQNNNEHVQAPSVPEEADQPLHLPEGGGLTAEQLFEIMKGKASILLIDVRSREAFDEGHIMTSSIICIEPSILLRDNISAEEISESMVLSPNLEQSLFEKRDSYDLVVFYDQESQHVAQSPRNSDELVVESLYRALVHLNYGRDLRSLPRILEGGLDAWVDLMGPGALKPTSPATAAAASAKAQKYKRKGIIQRKGSKYVVTSLQPADVRAWESTLERDARQSATRPMMFPRTGEEFLRFPPIPTQQQSMSSPTPSATEEGHQQHGLVHKFGSPNQLPAPPARPRAAVQRPSYNGLSQGENGDETYGESGTALVRQPAVRSKKAMEQVSGGVVKVYTGLNNPRNWCYANSVLQSLLASPGFGRELAESEWVNKYHVPRKANEKIDPPQLMMRIVSNLFHWMATGKFETMKAQTLMDYSRHLCKSGDGLAQFGGVEQQDAQEFMSFITEQLHDETNPRRDRTGNAAQPRTQGRPLVESAVEFWQGHSEFNDSIIDRYWRGLEVSTVECMDCHTRTHTFSPFGWVPVTVNSGRDMTLPEVLSQHVAGNRLEDFACDHCQGKRNATQSMSFARLPPLLCISFRRFNFDGNGLSKCNTAISWDFNDLDFSPYFVDAAERAGAGGDKAFSGPFRYECYAVIVHSGRQLNTGHYFAYVRGSGAHDPYAWYCCNDSSVSKVRIGSGDSHDVQRDVFRSDTDRVPYLVFFRRKGA